MSRAGFRHAIDAPFVIELNKIVRVGGDSRPGVQIARQYPMRAIGEKIKLLPAMQRAAHHALAQAAYAQALILLGQAGDLGLDDLVSLGVQSPARVPISEEQQRAHRNGEQQHIDQDDSKCLGSEKAKAGAHCPPLSAYLARII